MHTSQKGLLALLHNEAVVLSPYKDSVGVWTIGAGVTEAAVDPATWHELMAGDITIEDAFKLFRIVLRKYEADVNAAFTKPISQEQFDAAVSFHWNTGAIKRASWVKMYNVGRPMDDVANAMMQWIKPKALFARRRAEKLLFTKGEYPSLDVHLYNADANGVINWHSARKLAGETAIALLEKGEVYI